MSGRYGLKRALAPFGWRVLTGAWRISPAEPSLPPGGPCIFACLHRDILPAIIHVKSAAPVLLVSNSPDGDLLVRTLGERHYGFVRGASGDDGGRAFVLLKRALESGRHLGVAVDGPEGPFGVVQPGVLRLARATGATILPMVAEARRATILATWDRTVLPWPASSITMHYGPALTLASGASADDEADARRHLAAFFESGEVVT